MRAAGIGKSRKRRRRYGEGLKNKPGQKALEIATNIRTKINQRDQHHKFNEYSNGYKKTIT